MDNASPVDFLLIQSLNYPPNHPLTLALEFAKTAAHENEVGSCSKIISGWIRDQRPGFAIKVILENGSRDLFGNLCAFGRSAAAMLEEPESMMHAMESLFVAHANRSFGPNQYELCQYRCSICEGYADGGRLERVRGWLSRIDQKDVYDATIHRVTALLLKKGQLEKVEQWGKSLPAGSGARVLWMSIAQERLQRHEVNSVVALINQRLGGCSETPLQILGGLIDVLRKANCRAEADKWTECALARIRKGLNDQGAYLPFEIVCACKWLERPEDVEYLWPLYESHTRMHTDFLSGKGCYGSAMDHYVDHFRLALTAGFSDLADRVAELYKDFMAGSNSPPETIAAAREQLAARSNHGPSPDKAVAPAPQASEAIDYASTIQQADVLPERQREDVLCQVCYNSINARQWNHAIFALKKIARLSKPLNGPHYLRAMAGRICIGAGHFEALTEDNVADLRSILVFLQTGERNAN
jgi:hypothetical protein